MSAGQDVLYDDGREPPQSFAQMLHGDQKKSLKEENSELKWINERLEARLAILEQEQTYWKKGQYAVRCKDLETQKESLTTENVELQKANKKFKEVHAQFVANNNMLGIQNRKYVHDLETFHRRDVQMRNQITQLKEALENATGETVILDALDDAPSDNVNINVEKGDNSEKAGLTEGKRDNDKMDVTPHAEPTQTFNDPVQPMKKIKKKELPGEKQKDEMRKLPREKLEEFFFASLCDRVNLLNAQIVMKRSKDSADKVIRELKWHMSRLEKEVADAKDPAVTNLNVELVGCKRDLAMSLAQVSSLQEWQAQATAEGKRLELQKEDLLKQLAEANKDFNAQLERMQNDHAATTAAITGAPSGQMEELKRNLDQANAHINALQLEYTQSQGKITSLESELSSRPTEDDVAARTTHLEASLATAGDDFNNAQNHIKELQATIDANPLADEAKTLRSENERLTQKIESYEKEAHEYIQKREAEKQSIQQQWNESVAEANSRIGDLEARLAISVSADVFNNLQAEKQKLEEYLQNQAEAYNSLQLDRSRKDEEMQQRLNDMREQHTKERQVLSSELEMHKERVSALIDANDDTAQLEKAVQERQILSQENKKLLSELESQAQRLEDLVQKNGEYSYEIRQLSSSIESVREENSGLSAEKTRLLSEFKAQAQRLEDLVQKNAEDSDEIKRLSSSIESIREENSGLKAQAQRSEDLLQENAKYSDEIKLLSSSIESIREENSGLSATKLNLTSELKAQAERLEELVQENTKYSDEIKLLSSSTEPIREENSEFSAAKTSLSPESKTQAEQLEQLSQVKERFAQDNTDLTTALTAHHGQYDKLVKGMKEMQCLYENSKEDWTQKEGSYLAEIAEKESERQNAVDRLSEVEARHTIVENNLRTSLLSEKEDLENTIDAIQAELLEKETRLREMETSRHEAIQRANAADMTATELRDQLSSLEDTLEEMSVMELSLQKETRRLQEKCDSLRAELEQERQYTDSLQIGPSSEPVNFSRQATTEQGCKTMRDLETANRNIEQTFQMLNSVQPLANLLDDEQAVESEGEDETTGEDDDIRSVHDRDHALSTEPSDESDDGDEYGTRPATPAGTQVSFADRGTTMAMNVVSEDFVTDIDTLRHFFSQGEGNDAAILHSNGDVTLLEQFRQIKADDITNETVVNFTEFAQRQPPLVLYLTEFSRAIGRYEGSATVEIEGSENGNGSGKCDQSVQTEERHGKDRSMQTEDYLGTDQSVQTEELVKDVQSVQTDEPVEVEETVQMVEETLDGEVGSISLLGRISRSLWDKPLWHWQWVLLLMTTLLVSVTAGGNTAGFAWCLLAGVLCLYRGQIYASGRHIGLKWILGISMLVLWILPLMLAIYDIHFEPAQEPRKTHESPFLPELVETFQWGFIVEPLLDQVSELTILIVGDAHPPLY